MNTAVFPWVLDVAPKLPRDALFCVTRWARHSSNIPQLSDGRQVLFLFPHDGGWFLFVYFQLFSFYLLQGKSYRSFLFPGAKIADFPLTPSSPKLLHHARSGQREGGKFIKYFSRPLPLIAFGWVSQHQLVRSSFPIGPGACQS